MKFFAWNEEKNGTLKAGRGVSFEEVVFHIMSGGLLEVVPHPRPQRYPGQRVFVVRMGDYVWLVPFVEQEGTVFLKTIIPSRKATRRHLGEGQS